MGSLEEIRQKLGNGELPVDLIKAGYKKSSVYHEARKLRSQLSAAAPAPDDELAELRRRKEVLKLEKEIADIQAAKEKLPDRVAALEAEVVTLRKLIRDAVDNALYCSVEYTAELTGAEMTPERKAWCEGFVEFIERETKH